MSSKDRCVICESDADASALSVQSASFQALSRWAESTCGKAISSTGRICTKCYINCIVKSEDRPKSSHKKIDPAEEDPRMSEAIARALPALSPAAATAEPTASEAQADGTPIVLNYDASIGVIDQVLSYASNVQQNNKCGCALEKGEGCELCLTDLELNLQQEAAADPEAMEHYSTANKRTFICGFCNEMVSKSKLQHFDAQCVPCEQSFKCRGLLRGHMFQQTIYCKNCKKKLHGNQAIIMHENKNECINCSKVFKCEQGLKIHMRKHHMCKQFFSSINNNHPAAAAKDDASNSCWHCSVQLNTLREKTGHQTEQECRCGMKFRCRTQFASHQVKCHENRPPLINCKCCSAKFKSGRELQGHLRKKIKCTECGFNFTCATLPGHRCEKPCSYCGETHAEPVGRLACRECDQKWPCEGALARHERTCVRVESPQEQEISTSSGQMADGGSRCRFCQVGCGSAAELEEHLRLVNCPRCGFLQPCRTMLDAHMRDCRFVASEGQHRCPMCSKTFQSAAFLGTHVVGEHTDVPEKKKSRVAEPQSPPEQPVHVKQERIVQPDVIVID